MSGAKSDSHVSKAYSCLPFPVSAIIRHQMAKEKVLIVDDDQMIRWALNEALRNWGYVCVEAGNVSAALAGLIPNILLQCC